MSPVYAPWTMEQVGWLPWLETVDEVGPTPEQAALVDKIATNPSGRAYWALLAHDAPVLAERHGLFQAIMYGHGGSRRSDRELSAVATSRVNGCPYCASVHARLYAQLTKDTPTIQRLLDEGVETELGERERAIVDFAVKLTRDPNGMTADDLKPLRQVGMSDLEILDVAHASAMFAWANRLLQTLGQPVLPTKS
jgi:uncharacterized peroxidase-related enzyme